MTARQDWRRRYIDQLTGFTLKRAGTSLSQVAATGCLAQLSEVTICVLLAQKAAFAKRVLVNFEWGTFGREISMQGILPLVSGMQHVA